MLGKQESENVEKVDKIKICSFQILQQFLWMSDIRKALKQKRSHKRSAFLQKTYTMLQNTQFQQILSWHSDGVGFIIYDCKKFAQKVLPFYFKHSNFNSYIRQLNMYGFNKKRATKNQSFYFHEKFQKDHKQLLIEIHRRAQNKTIKTENKKNSKIQSEFSIQLESQNQMKKEENLETHSATLGIQFLKVMTMNQEMLNSQIQIISQIIKDLKALKLIGFSEFFFQNKSHTIEEIENQSIQTLHEYVSANLQIKSQLMDRARMQMKSTQRLIQSRMKVETQVTLNEHVEVIRSRVHKDE